ncbi:peptidoglycan recognition protein family protein [Streptomyces toxytricini]|uniref:Peptidoglycan recognition protein n=1 Tax=Streptomyces toxytricini TaxID=67369 RepID=A0ABW8ENY2_STRT5
MRGFLSSAVGVAAAAATLALPLALSGPAAAASGAGAAVLGPGAASGAAASGLGPAADAAPAGSTRSLPLAPLGASSDRSAAPPATGLPETRGLAAREVERFSLVGVVWDDADAELHGRVQVRTRSVGTALWSDWQDVETHNSEHAPDLDTAERGTGPTRGATAPLWVGESDAIEVRVEAERPTARALPARLPSGLRIELVDPGAPPAGAADGKNGTGTGGLPGDDDKGPVLLPGMTMEMAEASSVNVPLAPLGATEIGALDKADSTADAVLTGEARPGAAAAPYIGPRPRIITRLGWGADEKLREKAFVYTSTVKAAFVHHTASGNNYACKDAPAVIRSMYRYHVVSSGWRDIGYNFLVDKCGTVYEGRAGGVARAVLGAHTMGFNTDSMGIAVIGTFTGTNPPAPAVKSVAALTAWKLGLFNRDPRSTTTLKSGGGNRYPKGSSVKMKVISGHRDGFATECPGKLLYGQLPTTRTASAKLQGR